MAWGHEPTRLYDRAPGYGIVRLERATRRITVECWPRWVDPSQSDEQYPVGPRASTSSTTTRDASPTLCPPIVVGRDAKSR